MYHLVHRYGPKDQPLFRKQPFRKHPLAMMRAAEHLMAGDRGDFLIEDDEGRIVTNDMEIRSWCKATRIP